MAAGLRESRRILNPTAMFGPRLARSPLAVAGPAGIPMEAKLSPSVRLLLHSSLIRDALSTLLTDSGFLVLREPGPPDGDATVIVDFEGCLSHDGIQAHRECGARIVALANEADNLTMSDDQIARLSGLLTYGLSADAFVQSLRLICSGERVFPRDVAVGRNRLARPNGNATRADSDRLSPREKEVLLQVVEGRANKVIARHLGITEATVKVHLKSLLRKINVGNRTQAAIWGLANLPELGDTPRGFV